MRAEDYAQELGDKLREGRSPELLSSLVQKWNKNNAGEFDPKYIDPAKRVDSVLTFKGGRAIYYEISIGQGSGRIGISEPKDLTPVLLALDLPYQSTLHLISD